MDVILPAYRRPKRVVGYPGPPLVDPFWDDVSLLLRFNSSPVQDTAYPADYGYDYASTPQTDYPLYFADLSQYLNKGYITSLDTPGERVICDTSIKKFGTGSARLSGQSETFFYGGGLFAGTFASTVDIRTHPSMTFYDINSWSLPFTIETWISWDAYPGADTTIASTYKDRPDGSLASYPWSNPTLGGFRLWLETVGFTGTLKYGLYDTYATAASVPDPYIPITGSTVSGSFYPTLNTWYHIALTCVPLSSTQNYLRLFVDGSLIGSNATAVNKSFTNRPFIIGGERKQYNTNSTIYTRTHYNSSRLLSANIDDFRLTIGTARYTGSTYAVPTSEFPNS